MVLFLPEEGVVSNSHLYIEKSPSSLQNNTPTKVPHFLSLALPSVTMGPADYNQDHQSLYSYRDMLGFVSNVYKKATYVC